MYSSFQLAKKYIAYRLTASNGKGHGIHSPFVFDFVKNILQDKHAHPAYKKLEALRTLLLKRKDHIKVQDFGAGSVTLKSKNRIVGEIANSSLKPRKYAQLLFRMVQYYKPQRTIELGTSLGITTGYLALANEEGVVNSFEGAPEIAAIAEQQIKKLDVLNVQINIGDFATTIPAFLIKNNNVDLVFIDGNHRRIPTLHYFDQFLKISNNDTILVFDDIHWSADMEVAWEIIKSHDAVTLTMDLFFVGVVLLKKEFKAKQHYTIRF